MKITTEIHARGGLGNKVLVSWNPRPSSSKNLSFPFFEVEVSRASTFATFDTETKRYTEEEFYERIEDWIALVAANSGTGGLFEADANLLTRLELDEDTSKYHTLVSVWIRGHMHDRLLFNINLMEE